MTGIFKLYRDAFRGIPRDVWLFSVVAFVNRVGTMVLPFLVLYLTQERGFSPVLAGAVISLYGVGSVAGTLGGGWLSDRIDPVRLQVLTLTAAAVLFTLLGWLRGPVAIACGTLAVGFAAECFRPANSLAIAQASGPEDKVRSFALRRLALNLGMTFGPAIGGVLAVRNYAWLFPVDGFTCLMATIPLWLLLRRRADLGNVDPQALPRNEQPSSEEQSPADAAVRSPWRDGPFLAVAGLSTLSALLLFQLWAAWPLALHGTYRMAEDQIGLLMAINTLVIVALEMALAQWLKDRAPLRVAAVGALLLGLGVGGILWGSTIGFAVLLVVVWTFGEMLLFPFLEGFVAHRAQGPMAGRFMGIFASSFSVAFVLAPGLGTWIYTHWGPAYLWHGCSVMAVLLCLLFLRVARRLERPRVGTAASPQAAR
ncbi:MAG: MFS transporter [Acidobacteriota bacterium]